MARGEGCVAPLLLRAACGGGGPTAPSAMPNPTLTPVPGAAPLTDAAQIAGRKVGAAVQTGLLPEDPTYAATFERHFDYVTAEWEMKWDVTESEPGAFDLSRGDRIMDFPDDPLPFDARPNPAFIGVEDAFLRR